MKTREIAALCLLFFAQFVFAATQSISGEVQSITGQRVTIVDSNGVRTTLTVPDARTLTTGDRIRIDYVPVGDALRATSVTKLPKPQ
jgi:hypothetical protein